MGFNAAIADRPLPRRRRGWSGTTVLALAAVAVSFGAAAWITDLSAFAPAALPGHADRISASFEDRFFPASIPSPAGDRAGLQPLDRSALTALDAKLRAAKNLLAPQLMSLGFRGGFVEARLDDRLNDANAKLVEGRIDDTRPAATTGIPLPRSRP